MFEMNPSFSSKPLSSYVDDIDDESPLQERKETDKKSQTSHVFIQQQQQQIQFPSLSRSSTSFQPLNIHSNMIDTSTNHRCLNQMTVSQQTMANYANTVTHVPLSVASVQSYSSHSVTKPVIVVSNNETNSRKIGSTPERKMPLSAQFRETFRQIQGNP